MDATNRTTNPTTSLVPLKNHCAVRQPSDRQSGPLPCRSAANVPQRLTLVDPPAAIAAPPLPGPAPAPAASGRQPESAPYRPPAAQISHPVCAATPQLPQQIRHIANTDVTAPFTASPADSNYPRHNLARNNRRQPQISQQSLMQACIQTQLDQLLRLDPDQIPATFKNTLVLMAETARDKNQPQFDAAREQHYAMAQATTAEQRSQARLEPEAGVAKEEQIAAHHFTVIENDPFASGSGYADCLLFALVQHMTGRYQAADDDIARRVKDYRQRLLQQGWGDPGVAGGFGPDGYMAPASASTLALISTINSDRISAGKPPLRVIIHEFSRLHDGTVAEFISAAGAAPDAAEVVHIQNAGGQHYEALTAQQPGGAAVKPFSAMPPEIAEPAPALPRQPEAERWLVLDDNQQEIINHCVPEHFYPLFSFISAFPLVVSEPGQPAPQVYASGQRLSAEQPVSELPDAIMISSSATTTLVTIKRAGFQDLSVSLPDADRVAILAAIPEDIYQTSDTELICALFIMTPEILYEKLTDHGREQYQQLISLTDLDNDDAIRERLDAAATFFANAPGGDTIPKGEFFRALNTNIEYTLLPSGKRKNFLKTHPGTSPVIITGKLIHYILAYLGSPPAEMYKPVTTLALQFADKSKTMTKYLYTLAKELPTGNEPHFSDAISQVMHYFKHDDINLKKIIRKIPEEIFHELEDKPIAATATQKRLEYYYNLFANAIENSNLDNDFIGSVMEAWWPILSATSYPFIKKKYPEMKKLLAANIRNNEEKYKDVCTLEDRVLSIFLSFVFQHPEAWSEYVAENFRRILSEVGGDGNTPLATIHLVDFFNDRVSAPKAHEVFRQLIGKNVKTKISNAISMLLAIETYPPNMITHIYHTSVEEAVKIYMFYWEKYRQIKIDNLGENQVVVVDNNQSLVYIDKRSKWQKHIEQKLDKPVILLPGMAGKVHSKDKFLSSYIYTNSDADPLLSAMLISFSGPLYRDDNKIMQQVKSKKRIIFLQEIIDANRVEDSSPARINQLNARLQHIIETTPLPPSLKKNKLNKQEEAKINEYNQLIESVLTIQIMLLSQGYGKNTDKLLSHNVIKNLCAIGIKTKVQSPLNILSEKAASDKITEETYLAIITRAIEQSLVNSQNPISDFIRQSVLASACETLKSREKLFLALAKIPLNQTYEQAGYGLFVDVARKEMERAAQGSEPGDRLSDLERQAFSTLLTAFPASWKIFTDAHKASSRKVINTEWLINSQCFLQAAPEVQILLLNFLANESQTVPTPFITQCLTTMHNGSALLPSDPNNADALKTAGYSIYDLENTLNRICNFLQQYDPSCFSDTIDAIFTLSQSLREKKGIRDISSALTNSLKGILNAIKTSDEPQYQRLLQQYPQLVKEKPLDVVYAPLFNKEESITYRTSDISSTSEPERVSSTSETAAEKTREEEKPKDPMIIYIGKEWQKACVDEQFSKTLPKATAALMAGDFQRVKFHSYANSHYFTFDVKRNDNQHVQRKGKGRVDGRAMLLQGSRNKWLFLGVGSHKEATEKFKLYKTTPQETINKMIGNPDSASQRLRFDNSSKTLQLLDTAESAPETR